LGFVWLLPMTIVIWTLYVLPLWITGQIKYEGALDFLIAKFVLIDRGNWYSRAWKNWGGWSGPCVVVYRKFDERGTQLILKHEYRHCQQQFVFGALHYPLYGLMFLVYLAFTNKNPYYDNPFEVDARKYAGV
jgi:hypothetical protein